MHRARLGFSITMSTGYSLQRCGKVETFVNFFRRFCHTGDPPTSCTKSQLLHCPTRVRLYSLRRHSEMGPVSHGLFLIRGTSLMGQHAGALRVTWGFLPTVSQIRQLSRLHRNAQRKKRKHEAKASVKARREASVKARREAFSQLAWRQERSDSLRTALMRQYEEEARPRWSSNSERLGQSFNVDTEASSEGSPRGSMNNQTSHGPERSGDVQCGIFWDIENVRNEYIPLCHRSDPQDPTLQQSSSKRFVTLLVVQLLQCFKRTCPASR
jgi:hypothetical protein